MMMQEQDERKFHSAFSNDYGYHDLCSSSAMIDCDDMSASAELDIDDFNTSCCVTDTSYDTADTTFLIDDDGNDDEDDNNGFEQLEEEFQILTSQLQTDVAKLSSCLIAGGNDVTIITVSITNDDNREEKIGDVLSSHRNNTDDNTGSTPPRTTIEATTTRIQQQLTECHIILQQLRNACKDQGNAVSLGNRSSENKFMECVQRLGLYKIQLEVLRSEFDEQFEQHTTRQQQQQQQQPKKCNTNSTATTITTTSAAQC